MERICHFPPALTWIEMGGCWGTTNKGGAATRQGQFCVREQTICFADDQGFEAANRNVSDAVSIRTIPAGKDPEELNCISSNRRRCVRPTPVPDRWLGLPDCGWAWPRPTRAHAVCTVCGERGELSPSVLGPQVCRGEEACIRSLWELNKRQQILLCPSIGSILFSSV